MKKPQKIKYTPLYTAEDMRKRIENLSCAISEALEPLHLLQECGAAEISDDEARYVQEMYGFLELIRLVEVEELAGAIQSVNKAFWEIEVAESEGLSNIEHPWLKSLIPGRYDTHYWSAPFGFEFNALDYAPMPKTVDDEVEQPPRKPSSAGQKMNDDPSGFGDF